MAQNGGGFFAAKMIDVDTVHRAVRNWRRARDFLLPEWHEAAEMPRRFFSSRNALETIREVHGRMMVVVAAPPVDDRQGAHVSSWP
jgi:hypothetical protein